jgi:hypothetical protein
MNNFFSFSFFKLRWNKKEKVLQEIFMYAFIIRKHKHIYEHTHTHTHTHTHNIQIHICEVYY